MFHRKGRPALNSIKEKEVNKTTDTVLESAWYVTECCNIEVTLLKNATFTRCPECERLTRWQHVRSLRTPGKAA
jgi:hypothetical protein